MNTKNLSKENQKILHAYNQGYYVDKVGDVFTKEGNKRTLFKRCKKGNYLAFSIKVNNCVRNVPVHKLQAYLKYGNKLFEPNIVVRHLNGISNDNSFDNIAIGTHSDNMMDMSEEIRIAKAKHAAQNLIKYDNVEEIKEFYNTCKSYKTTMEKFKITSKSTLHNILHNR